MWWDGERLVSAVWIGGSKDRILTQVEMLSDVVAVGGGSV